jgi:hypothetical protein
VGRQILLERENYNEGRKNDTKVRGHYFCYSPTQNFHYGQPKRTSETKAKLLAYSIYCNAPEGQQMLHPISEAGASNRRTAGLTKASTDHISCGTAVVGSESQASSHFG